MEDSLSLGNAGGSLLCKSQVIPEVITSSLDWEEHLSLSTGKQKNSDAERSGLSG